MRRGIFRANGGTGWQTQVLNPPTAQRPPTLDKLVPLRLELGAEGSVWASSDPASGSWRLCDPQRTGRWGGIAPFHRCRH